MKQKPLSPSPRRPVNVVSSTPSSSLGFVTAVGVRDRWGESDFNIQHCSFSQSTTLKTVKTRWNWLNQSYVHVQFCNGLDTEINAAVSPAKPPKSLDHEIDDPLYLMTLTIPQLFLKPLQVMWDASLFGLFNSDFPLYIKHEDLSEIAHGGQCLSISVIQLHLRQVCERGIPMCMDSSSHSPFRDLGNHNLNRKVTSRVGCRVQNAMSTLEPT
ncbi:hypothetical protein GmHk_03G007386 [Glycine max]|nr:hypothetical protein GmHk_03G007386 [Glycine max]